MSSSTTSEILEHIVLFKVKDDVDSQKIDSMVNALNNLATIDQVLYLNAGPIHQLKSDSSLAFTHVLHSRYRTKEDLNVYVEHPDHVHAVEEWLHVWDDFMAVDWITSQVPGTLAPPPGSVAKVKILKLKENVPKEVKTEIMEVMVSEKSCRGIDQITVGENLNIFPAKGFSIASVVYFKDLAEMEAHKELVKEKVGGFLDDALVVEFLVFS